MGSGQSQKEPPEASDFIPRSGNRVGDPLAVTYPDPDPSPSEQRFITVGMSSAGRVLMVAHVDRDENVRIVSARRTTQRERKSYEEEN